MPGPTAASGSGARRLSVSLGPEAVSSNDFAIGASGSAVRCGPTASPQTAAEGTAQEAATETDTVTPVQRR